MFPFIYYVDCEGNLWVPCSCGRGGGIGEGSASIETAHANVRREARERAEPCVRRDYECIRPASESERTMLHREQDLEKLLNEALEAIKRLERLHERDLVLAPGA